MKRLLNKLNRAYVKYDDTIRSAEAEISGKVQFEFHIAYQQGDGWVMVTDTYYNSKNAPLKPLLEIIKKKGVLTEEDYLKHTI